MMYDARKKIFEFLKENLENICAGMRRLVYVNVRMGISGRLDKNTEYQIFGITVKKNSFPVCNPNIFALDILGVKCCFHPSNDHVKAIQHRFTVKQGPGTKANF